MAIRIAIVEDEQAQREALEGHIRRYAEEKKVSVSISVFSNAVSFLDHYTAEYDLVFMDIMMPMMNGMDASRALREKDSKVLLIFITSMRQYAVQGYEVEATDFIVKPVSYPEFALKFARALTKLPAEREDNLLIHTKEGYIRLQPSQISYVEVSGHYCIFHVDGKKFQQYLTMKSVEEKLDKHEFVRCNNYLLVNLSHVERVEDYTVTVDGERLQISQPKRKAFLEAFLKYQEARKYD